jgi:hypothetical protein
MSKFKVGDKVKVVNDFHTWLYQFDNDRETVLTVVDDNDETSPDSNTCAITSTIDLFGVTRYPDDFELVIDCEVTNEQTVRSDNQVEGGWYLNKDGNFAVAGTGLGVVPSVEELGVYRPKLEDRKVGKVGMHFVVDGFPNALREIAKVMDWAADVKGYALHDWKNLPNAALAFPSAEYRHQNDNSIQKAQGLTALERVDHESKLLHAAHKVFNGLAELELILTGVIK